MPRHSSFLRLVEVRDCSSAYLYPRIYHGSRRKLAKIVVTQESGGRIDDKAHHKAQIETGKLQTAILEQD